MVKSYVLISCAIGAEDELKTKLLEIENIEKTTITYGQYDIVAEIETQKDEDMAKLIIQKIRQLEKIRTTVTLNVLH